MIAEIYDDHVVLRQEGELGAAWLPGKVTYITTTRQSGEWIISISAHTNGAPTAIVFVTTIQKGANESQV